MTERFPPDCSPVSGRFRNTTFICWSFGCFASSRSLPGWRPFSFGCFAGAPRSLPGLAPPCFGPSAARWRSALTPGACAPLFWSFAAPLRSAPRVTSLDYSAPLRCALATGLSPCLAPSAAPLSLRASGYLARLLRCAALRARDRAGAPSGSFGCSAGAARLGSPRSTAPLRCALAVGLAPRLAPSAAPLSLRASGHLARLLRFAARSRRGLSPCLAPSTAPLSFSEHVRARFHKRRACATLAGAAAHGFSCPLHPFLTCL